MEIETPVYKDKKFRAICLALNLSKKCLKSLSYNFVMTNILTVDKYLTFEKFSLSTHL